MELETSLQSLGEASQKSMCGTGGYEGCLMLDVRIHMTEIHPGLTQHSSGIMDSLETTSEAQRCEVCPGGGAPSVDFSVEVR